MLLQKARGKPFRTITVKITGTKEEKGGTMILYLLFMADAVGEKACLKTKHR